MKRRRMAAVIALCLLLAGVVFAAVSGGPMGVSAGDVAVRPAVRPAARPAVQPAAQPAAARVVVTQTVTLAATRDNTLYDNLGNVSNGAGQHFFAGSTNNDKARRGLIAFDLSGIPPDAIVISATLRLNMSKTIAGETAVSVHAAAAGWGEGESDALGEEGAGAAATPGDATWTHAFFDGALWAAPGGDFAGAASATTMVGSSGSYLWASPGLLADVAGWVADPATNFGWAVLGDEAQTGTAKRFDSRENPSAGNRPALVVTYAAEVVDAPPVYVPVVLAQ